MNPITGRGSRPRQAGAVLLFAALLATVVASPQAGFAAGSPKPKGSDESAFEEGRRLVERGSFARARNAFERANDEKPSDPDVLNMLAYTQRKTGKLDLAIDNYKRALKLRPDFPQAHEYLAEAYLQLALRQLKVLERYGESAEAERQALEEAIRAAAAGLPERHENRAEPTW
jgi:tetratricopeptide (TPR) repeat protein